MLSFSNSGFVPAKSENWGFRNAGVQTLFFQPEEVTFQDSCFLTVVTYSTWYQSNFQFMVDWSEKGQVENVMYLNFIVPVPQ